MAAEEVLQLLDSHWFGHETSTKTPSPRQSPFVETEEEEVHVRSMSDLSLFSKTSSDHLSFSPNSVLFSAATPTLQPILSGKLIKDNYHVQVNIPTRKSTRRRKKVSKSMSELELDEVKGFMDLGFVFSEEDKGSSLVSIIPGLHRFGSTENDDEDTHVVVSRPYLSEAWDGLEQRRENEKMMNWRVPSQALGSQVDMKDHLKLWAHSVASTVR